jgi:hypothetical protein
MKLDPSQDGEQNRLKKHSRPDPTLTEIGTGELFIEESIQIAIKLSPIHPFSLFLLIIIVILASIK